MSVQALLASLGLEIEDPEEESFLLFSQSIPSQNLGFVDPKAALLNISIDGHDLNIRQSPTILSSNRDGGTTGAVVWKITPLVAAWIISPDNPLFKHNVLHASSSVLELGCGISGIIGLALGPFIQQYILTDQEYVMKYLKQNLLDNMPIASATACRSRNTKARSSKGPGTARASCNIRVQSLDWETDDVSSIAATLEEGGKSFDVIIACDCIYNDALIPPLVQTCVDICQFRKAETEDREAGATLCIVAQQLRSAEVFEEWLKAFHNMFRVWRLSDADLTGELASNSGFVIHIGVLR